MHRPIHFSRRLFLLKVGLAIALSLAFGVSGSQAELFTTPTGSKGSDGSLSATADFEFSAGQLTITLTNTLATDVFKSAGQALSDISFTLSNAPGTLSSATASGQFGNIDGSGNVSYTSSDTATDGKSKSHTYTTPTRWEGDGGFGSFSISSSSITLETIGGGQPSQMIAPNIANGGTYTNANNGLQNFNAYVIGPATFTLALSGVTKDTTVESGSVQFSFGTGPDTFVSGIPGGPGPPVVGTPAPPSVVLLGFGGLGLAIVLTRSRRRLAVAV